MKNIEKCMNYRVEILMFLRTLQSGHNLKIDVNIKEWRTSL